MVGAVGKIGRILAFTANGGVIVLQASNPQITRDTGSGPGPIDVAVTASANNFAPVSYIAHY